MRNKGLEALDSIIETFYDKESEDIQIVRKELKLLEFLLEYGWFNAYVDEDNPNVYWFNYDGKLIETNKEEYEFLKEMGLSED